jgi:glyoxylase-like metal-dependent hydrolase (beta-lactamase superfamily II)
LTHRADSNSRLKLVRYLESLAKLEALNAAILLPGHDPVIEDAAQAIRRIRKKLLKRHSILYAALQEGEKSMIELIQLLIDNPLIHFFPGCGIIESHLKTFDDPDLRGKNHGIWVQSK